jgi:D-sedoheptulose 7-phosphate isomerase
MAASALLLTETLEREEALVERMARRFAETAARGKTIFFCGNGGSAAEAQHLAAELVGRFLRDRRALPAIALTTDSSILTSVGNDSGFGSVYARQIEALGKEGDLLVAMTTSGRSPNVLAAVEAARARGLIVLGMTGAKGAGFAQRCDLCLIVPSEDTPRIQEVHLVVGHLWCERAESALVGERIERGGEGEERRSERRERGGGRGERSRAREERGAVRAESPEEARTEPREAPAEAQEERPGRRTRRGKRGGQRGKRGGGREPREQGGEPRGQREPRGAQQDKRDQPKAEPLATPAVPAPSTPTARSSGANRGRRRRRPR